MSGAAATTAQDRRTNVEPEREHMGNLDIPSSVTPTPDKDQTAWVEKAIEKSILQCEAEIRKIISVAVTEGAAAALDRVKAKSNGPN